MTPQLRTYALSALAAAHVVLLVLCAAVVPWFDLPPHVVDEFLGWYCAVIFVQANLLALWHCWGPGRLVKWWALATPLALPLSAGMLWLVGRDYLSFPSIELLGSLYVLHLLAVHVACVALKMLRGWRLVDTLTDPDPAPRDLVQFGWRQFVLWTLLLVILHAVGRWAVLATGGPAPSRPRWDGLSILLGGNALMFALAMWAVFVRDSGLLWLALTSLLAMVLTGLEIVLLHTCRIQILVNEVYLWAFNGTQFGLLMVSLLAIRGCGCRLRRRMGTSAFSG